MAGNNGAIRLVAGNSNPALAEAIGGYLGTPLTKAIVRRFAELGYDERFQRIWRLYLSYCEAGFAERRIGDVQVLLAKPGWRSSAFGKAQLSGAAAG